MVAYRTLVRLGAILPFFFALAAQGVAGDEVFAGPPADYESAPPHVEAGEPGVLRWIWVEERLNRPRSHAPVRIPLFLSQGECREPGDLKVVRWPSREEVPLQYDDVRRGPDGGVARLHVWLVTDLQPGESQRWALVRKEASPAAGMNGDGTTSPVGSKPRSERAAGLVVPPPKTPVSLVTGERIRVSAGGTTAEFFSRPESGGALASLLLDGGPALDFPNGAGASVVTDKPGDRAPQSTVTAASGPVFAKVVVVRAGSELNVTQVYRLFGDGSLNLAQTIAAPERALPAVKTQEFLSGRLEAASAPRVSPQPAGMVAGLEDFHPGYAVDVLAQPEKARAWLLVPGTIGGVAGRVRLQDGTRFTLQAPGGFKGGQAGQSAYWAEVTFVPTDRQALPRAVLDAAQPLVGVVERPGLTREIAAARVLDNVREMKPVGWVNETVGRSLQGKDAFPRRRWATEADLVYWTTAAQRAREKVAAGRDQLREDEKGRAAGPLDPYHITYGSTALVPWLWRGTVPAPVLASIRAQLTAVRTELGRADADGSPYLDVFNRALNMQMGPTLLALSDPGLDPATRDFYRRLLAAPVVKAVALRGLRPYSGQAQAKAEESDTVYQAVVDFMLRASEMATGEPLGFQPVAYGRFLDTIDVMADLYVPAHPRSPDDAQHFARANFFRAQSHQHRWLNWGPATFIALLRAPVAPGETVGVTEAWYYADQLAGRWKNWPDQSWLYLAATLKPDDAPVPAAAAAKAR